MSGYRFLVLGNGGREHAISWALAKSPKTAHVFTAPGNPGTSQCGTNLDLDILDSDAVVSIAKKNSIDIVVIGPEQPLVDGLADQLRNAGIAVFGPDQYGAQLEGSKEFAKNLMAEFNVPTAAYNVFNFSEREQIEHFIKTKAITPIVLKADGLAAGKGVFICETKEDALERLNYIQSDSNLAKAAGKLVIEEFMAGEEASVFAICDGKDYVLLSAAQDHKRVGEGDTGLNTGGMGAYTPAPIVTESILAKVEKEVVQPMLLGLQEKGHPYIGVLYCGLMIEGEQVRVVEFNCRFGDPECQVILPQLESDVADLIVHASKCTLNSYSIKFKQGYHCSVVMASKGYPEQYEKGKVITGIENLSDSDLVFHSGTKMQNEAIVSNGGRVLNVVGFGSSLQEAIDSAYKNIQAIQFEGAFYRKDIGKKGLNKI